MPHNENPRSRRRSSPRAKKTEVDVADLQTLGEARARPSSKPTPLAQIDSATLASLLSSRICHDLISPIAAITHGVEFLEDDVAEENRDHAVRVIRDGARDARGRLGFFRAAFGVSSAMGDRVQLDEVRSLAQDYFAGGRIRLEWAAAAQPIDRAMMQLLLNQILIVAESLPRGGKVEVGVVNRGATNMVVMAEGPKIKMGELEEELLRSGSLPAGEKLEPKKAPILLTYRLAETLKAKLTLAAEDDRIVLAYTM